MLNIEIEQTKKWIKNVVVGCNFCPFASKVIKQQAIHYQIEKSMDLNTCLEAVLTEAGRLDNKSHIVTSFLIFPNSFELFDRYLHFLSLSEKLFKKKGYNGIYQIASFHPLYQFEGSAENDPANYTNRSVYPMLHFLREEIITNALKQYVNPENIPLQNINFAREKGLLYMKMLRETCF